MKHVGKMKSNSARIAVVYRTVPNEPQNCLVVGTTGLPDSYHDSLMSVIESDSGQQANELADILATRRFPDGEIMLQWLHTRGHLKKVPTNLVLLTPNAKTQVPLNVINDEIAKSKQVNNTGNTVQEEIADLPQEFQPIEKPVTASDLRSMADKLFKEAQALRKKADELEPPVKKATKTKVEA